MSSYLLCRIIRYWLCAEYYGRMIPISMHSITVNKIKMYENGNQSISIDEVKRMLQKAYYIADSRIDNNVKEVIKEYYEKHFKEKIEIF